MENENEIAKALSDVAQAIKNHDSTPNPTRKQFVREAALKLLTAHVGSQKSISISNMDIDAAIKIGDTLWDKTFS